VAVSGGSAGARRELGQHFLVDENILGVVGRLADLSPVDVVLEIGPGPGMLTRYLADRVAHVVAVEIDRSLEPALAEKLEGVSNVELVFGDAVRLDLASLAPSADKLVANLPYSVATPLVVDSLDGLPRLRRWCVMVQREVADRFFATPGTRAYGAVSVLVQLATERVGFHPVARTVFRPRPNVDSALVAFERIPLPPDYAAIKTLVQAAFSHRRKTLANSLALAGLAGRERAASALGEIGLAADSRAEALTPHQFASLARVLT
jgi:16S rRNA (adenine1518-N6/adenine1519-N6)-dimethyltransferase